MGKYKNLIMDLYKIIEEVPYEVFPNNFFKELKGEKEYIEVTIIPDSLSVNMYSVGGIVILNIYTKAGEGPLRYCEIADSLDYFFLGKTMETTSGNVTQFIHSTLAPRGISQQYPAVYIAEYTLQFKYFAKEN